LMHCGAQPPYRPGQQLLCRLRQPSRTRPSGRPARARAGSGGACTAACSTALGAPRTRAPRTTELARPGSRGPGAPQVLRRFCDVHMLHGTVWRAGTADVQLGHQGGACVARWLGGRGMRAGPRVHAWCMCAEDDTAPLSQSAPARQKACKCPLEAIPSDTKVLCYAQTGGCARARAGRHYRAGARARCSCTLAPHVAHVPAHVKSVLAHAPGRPASSRAAVRAAPKRAPAPPGPYEDLPDCMRNAVSPLTHTNLPPQHQPGARLCAAPSVCVDSDMRRAVSGVHGGSQRAPAR